MIIETARRNLYIVQTELQLPTTGGEAALTGSHVLALLGIRPGRDVDIVVRQPLFANLGNKFEINTEEDFPRICLSLPSQTGPIEVDIFSTNGPFGSRGGRYVPMKDFFKFASECEFGCLPVVGFEELGITKEGMGKEFGIHVYWLFL